MPGISSRNVFVVLIALALVVSAVGIGASVTSPAGEETETQETSYLRVAHASPDAPAVDVYVENESVLTNVSFGNVSDYLELSAGTYNLTITAADDPDTVVFEDAVTVEPRTVTTVAASGEISEDASTSFEPVFFDDSGFTPATNESALRIVHLSPDAPTVDVTAGNGSVVLADNVSFQNASDYTTLPAGDYTAEIRAASEDNNGSIVTTVDVSLEAGTAYSAMAVGYLNPDEAPADTPFEVVPTEDATSTVNLPSDQLPAALRVVHLSPDAPAVDVTADNGSVVLAENVSYGESSEYVTVPAGDYTAEIRAASEDNNGSVVTTVDVSLEAGTAYSAMASGFLEPGEETDQPAFEVRLLEDGTKAVQMPWEMSDGPGMNGSEMGNQSAADNGSAMGNQSAAGNQTQTGNETGNSTDE